jgi:hypothetical protein
VRQGPAPLNFESFFGCLFTEVLVFLTALVAALASSCFTSWWIDHRFPGIPLDRQDDPGEFEFALCAFLLSASLCVFLVVRRSAKGPISWRAAALFFTSFIGAIIVASLMTALITIISMRDWKPLWLLYSE